MLVLKVHYYEPGESAETRPPPLVFRIENFPCTVGRSPENDVQVPHSSVSSRHAVIEMTRLGPAIRDMGSANGIRYQGKMLPRILLGHGRSIQVGRAWIEIEIHQTSSEGRSVKARLPAPTLASSSFPAPPVLGDQERPRGALLYVLIAYAAHALLAGAYWRLRHGFTMTDAALALTLAPLLALLVAAPFAVVARLQTGSFRLTALLALSLTGLLTGKLASLLSPIVVFNVDMPGLTDAAGTALLLCLPFVFLHLMGRIASPRASALRVALTAGALVAAVAATGLTLRAAGETAESGAELLKSTVAYPLRRFERRTHPASALLGEMDRSIARTAEERSRERQKQ